MSTGVIDIGSNTIRAVVYDEELTPVKNSAVHAELVRFVQDGQLLEEGKRRLVESLLLLKMQVDPCDRVFVFATSALRTVEDRGELLAMIKEETGFTAEILSEEEEAACGQLVLTLVGVDDAVGFDLGGGSMQIFSPDQAKSLKLGSLRLFLEEGSPQKAYERARQELGELPPRKRICGMGGTVRAIGDYFSTCLISADMLRRVMSLTPEEASAFGRRDKSIGCGAAAALAVMEACTAEEIAVLHFGVREGYLMMKGM